MTESTDTYGQHVMYFPQNVVNALVLPFSDMFMVYERHIEHQLDIKQDICPQDLNTHLRAHFNSNMKSFATAWIFTCSSNL